MKAVKIFLLSLCIILLCGPFFHETRAYAWQTGDSAKDSLVRLVRAVSARLVEKDGMSFRKVEGPAVFLHNNTYLYCDSAYWNVNDNFIDAVGNVRIEQKETKLLSDRLHYVADRNVAEFRGRIVELVDKDNNRLRTRNLDYHTKDSIALFFGGGAMVDKDGNVIESLKGEYRSKEKLFIFSDMVEMYSDSLLVSSDEIRYSADKDIAYFGTSTRMWNEDNLLFAETGFYDRNSETVSFSDAAHILTPDQEIFSDSLVYYRPDKAAELFGNVQIEDESQSTLLFGDYAYYRDEPFEAYLTDKPSFALYGYDKGMPDTLFFSSDTLKVYKRLFKDIEESEISMAKERLRLNALDPVAEFRNKGRKETRQTGRPPVKPMQPTGSPANTDAVASSDSTAAGGVVQADTLSAAYDAVSDTLQVSFLNAYHDVRFFKNDMQGKADSLIYTTLDSITRLYGSPVMWSDVKNQFTSDSMQIVTEGQMIKRANLISSAFIVSHEDSCFYNQIKSTEMTAFFKDNDLVRFDALGGVSALFFLKEENEISTMNKKESKMLSVTFRDREVQRLHYMEDIKNDASSVVGLVENDFRLRDFRWLPEERPASRYDVCTRGVRPSMRMEAKGFAIPSYRETDFYFDGYMSPLLAEVRSGMVSRDSLRRAESVRKGDDTGRKDENRRLEAQEQKDAYAREDVRRTIVNDSRKSYFSLYIGEKMSKGMGMEEVSRMKQAIKYSQDKISNDQRRKEKYNKERKKDKIRF